MSDTSCPHCSNGLDRELARRQRVLHLVALIEHPTALAADAKLRIAGELLAWLDEPDARGPTTECAPHGVAMAASA